MTIKIFLLCMVLSAVAVLALIGSMVLIYEAGKHPDDDGFAVGSVVLIVVWIIGLAGLIYRTYGVLWITV